MKKLASVAVSLSSFLLAAAAHAQTPAAFGDSGTLVLHAATGDPMLSGTTAFGREGGSASIGATPTLGIHKTRYGNPDGANENGTPCTPNRPCDRSVSHTAIYLAPRIHYFVIDNLSIGGEILLASFSSSSTSSVNGAETTVDSPAPTAFGIMPLIGYNVRIGDKFSLWPTGGIGFRRVSVTIPAEGNRAEITASEPWWFVNFDLPFLFHPTTNFAIGAGPGITATLSRSNNVKQGPEERSVSGFSTLDIRFLTAHMIGWF